METLNVLPPSIEPHATGHIIEQEKLVQEIPVSYTHLDVYKRQLLYMPLHYICLFAHEHGDGLEAQIVFR